MMFIRRTAHSRHYRGVLAITAGAVLLAGCTTVGDGGGSGSETPPPTPPQSDTLFAELSSLPAGPSEELIEAARAESGRLTTYLSFTTADMAPIFEAFQEAYPFVTDAVTVELAAGATSARLVQEGLAGGPTGDYGETPANYLLEALDRDLLLPLDAELLGLPEEMLDSEHTVPVSANLWGLMINTDLVTEAERPKTWDDLLDERWSDGNIAMWSNAAALGNLEPAWGQSRLAEYVDDFLAQGPQLISTPPAVVQAISAGEVPLGIMSYAQATSAAGRGAPVAWFPLDIVSVSPSVAYIPSAAENPNTGMLFLAWFASEGYEIKESVTHRGVPNLPGNTQEVVDGFTLSGWRTDQSDRKADVERWITDLLPRG